MDSEPGQVNSDCLAVPLVLREIFQSFTSTELLELSLVNKQWSYEARSLIKARGNIIASINKNQTCSDLRAFASDLRRMRDITKVVPFSGMTISVGWTTCGNTDYCQQSTKRELQPVYEDIVEGTTWKHLTLRHLDGWEQHTSCPAFVLGKKILVKFHPILEELSIELQWETEKYFQEKFLQDCQFFRLKTFKFLNEWGSFGSGWSEMIRTLVSNAPNLQVLYTKGMMNLKDNLLEGSSAVHVTGSSYSPSRNEIPENVASEIKMNGMNLLSFSSDFNLERFNRITRTLLQSSSSIMSSMTIDIIFLAPLMNYGICLENVRTFTLGLDPVNLEQNQPPILRIAKSFDFTRTFPNLNIVTIIILYDYRLRIPQEFDVMIQQGCASLKTPTLDRAANIKLLKLRYLPRRVLRRRSSFSLLAQIFPNVQKVSVLTPEITLADIRDIWAELEEVDFTLVCMAHTLSNHDSVFCGIFPEEVAQLRQEDEEYLRRVNIVPVKPTIAYVKELRAFEVYYEKRMDSYMGPLDDPTCLFSKVTPLIAFQRCPNLTVTVTTEDERLEKALGHLRPYVPVVFKQRTNLHHSL